MKTKTSSSNPLFVDFLPVPGPGRIGITMAPGRQQVSLDGATRWQRDLGADLERLATYHRATRLVCLLEDRELAALGVPEYEARVAERGLALTRHPIPDGRTPGPAVADLVETIDQARVAGEVVIIHCAGGLGRAGTVAGCLLRRSGFSGGAALAVLTTARGPRCPETEAQRQVIRDFLPEPDSTARPVDRDHLAGAVLGGAIGDAMGHPTEFLSMEQIRGRFGPTGVEGFELWQTDGGRRSAPYTDDTQMAEQVLRGLLDTGARDLDATMRRIGERFVGWSRNPQGGHRAPGNACLRGCAALAAGTPWREAGGPQAGGCGSVMRAYPFGLFFADDVEMAARWAAEHSRLTHNAADALAACAAMATGVALTLRGEPNREVLPAMLAAAVPYSSGLAKAMMRAWHQAEQGADAEKVLDRLRGWSAHEAICAAVFLLARLPDEPRTAILAGANTPGDSDSIATLAGALLGARHGLSALPADWVRDVERSADLLALADKIRI